MIRSKEAQTLPQLISAAARTYGAAPAVSLRDKGDGNHALSFTELEQRSVEMARRLLAWGVGKDLVASLCKVLPEIYGAAELRALVQDSRNMTCPH